MMAGIQARELGGCGGTHTYLESVLPRLADAYDGTMVLFHADAHRYTSDGSDVVHVDSKTNRPILSDHVVLPFLLKRWDIDVAWFPKNVVPIAYDGPAIVTVHDLGYFVRSDFYPFADRTYMKRMIRHSCRVADAIIAVSENTKRDILTYTSADEDAIEVIHHGIDGRFWSDPTDGELRRFRREHGLTGPTIYGGNVGRRKNVCRLVDAFERTDCRAERGVELVFTGRTPPREQAAAIDASGATRHLGYIDADEMPYLYGTAELFVYPSLYEGFGLPPLEAMAAGTPVITSDRASLPEVVGEGAALVDPGDVEGMSATIDELLSDEDRRDRLLDRGETRARQFTWERTARRTMEVLANVA